MESVKVALTTFCAKSAGWNAFFQIHRLNAESDRIETTEVSFK